MGFFLMYHSKVLDVHRPAPFINCGATCLERLSGDVGTEIVLKAFDEPGPEWDCTIQPKPELGVEGEKHIMGFCVILHDWVGVGSANDFLDHNSVTFECGVSFFGW